MTQQPLPNPTRLVLASSSPYRRNLLEKLGLPFTWADPSIDESPYPGEQPETLAKRLAIAKAKSLAPVFPDALIIGSDQVADLNGQMVNKPLDHSRAKKQLLAARGQTLTFYTGLCLYDAGQATLQSDCLPYRVSFRALTEAQIESYLLRDKPYDCAGSIKAEGLGITLLSRLDGEDPNVLIGLPLIRLTRMLTEAGLDPLAAAPINR